MATGTKSRERTGQRGKSIEEVVTYAISNRTRVELLIILNQGTYCATELGEIIGKPTNVVSNHLKEMAEGGAIEVAEVRKVRNWDQLFYRAVEIPMYTDEELIEMHPVQRHFIISLVTQSLIAEMLAALWAKKFTNDPHHCLVWDRLNLDQQGRREIDKEQRAHWERMAQIEEKSLLRAADSGEVSVPYMVAALGFVRGRKAPVARRSGSGD